jgi:NAD(P)-dependent dehydrogenase (short-subunit alcohol dehydrogenase family)
MNTVLLTGGTGKLGRVLVQYLSKKGWCVITASREQARIDQLLSEVGAVGSVFGIVADLQQPCATKNLIEELTRRGHVITHLINNARSIDTLVIESNGLTKRSSFVGEFEMDVVVPYELSMCLARSDDHRVKSIVNIGSMYGEVAPNPALYGGLLDSSPVQYGVSKAGLHHLTRELAVRLAPHQIRVNCVAYGGVEGRADEAFNKRYAQLVPSRRMLQASEVIGPVDFLLSEASSAVNGHVLVADGGWSVW